MQLKDLKTILIILTIIQLGIALYYTPNTLEYIFNSITNISDGLFGIGEVLKQILNITFTIIGAIGVGLYFYERENVSNILLKLYLLHHAFGVITYLPNRLMLIINPPGSFSFAWYHHVFFFLSLSLLIITAITFSKVAVRTIPKPVNNKGIRFVHYIIDSIYINIMLFGNAYLFISGFGYGSSRELNMIIGWILLLLMPVLYYLTSEAIFRQSIGKVITGTYVSSTNGRRAPFANIIGRTLCRLIPFEHFSFLADDGKWHDRFSGTDVFYKSNTQFEAVDNPIEDTILDHPIN